MANFVAKAVKTQMGIVNNKAREIVERQIAADSCFQTALSKQYYDVDMNQYAIESQRLKDFDDMHQKPAIEDPHFPLHKHVCNNIGHVFAVQNVTISQIIADSLLFTDNNSESMICDALINRYKTLYTINKDMLLCTYMLSTMKPVLQMQLESCYRDCTTIRNWEILGTIEEQIEDIRMNFWKTVH